MPENEFESKIAEHYSAYPYPKIPVIASIPKEQLWQINFEWLARKNGIATPSRQPSIWIAGCGTFQPYTMAQANPTAGILATDLSETSLKIAKKRCFLHQKRNIDFSTLNLNNFDSYPDETFDWIECYGVLMSVKDPLKTLKEFTKRLKPNGFIRIMVYPHYGRQRIFQIQEVARLLNLTLANPKSPVQLKKLMYSLPDSHPLKYAFFSYDDSRNKEGIADAFLHPNDRAFTGFEISKIIVDAGLEISSTLHRPWGQPREMAEKLGLTNHSPAFWLHYLDMWQSLRSNFIFCLRKKDSEYVTTKSDRHALFDFFQKGTGLTHRMHLARIAVTGSRLQTRTEENLLDLTGQDVRKILSHSPHKLPAEKQKLIPGFDKPEPLKKLLASDSIIEPLRTHFLPRLNEYSINPLYDHLFDAYTSSSDLPHLKDQISRWSPLILPLEDSGITFGLTPYGTFMAKKHQIELYMAQKQTGISHQWKQVQLLNEHSKFKELHTLLKTQSFSETLDSVTLRKLWVLLLSHPYLLLPFKLS